MVTEVRAIKNQGTRKYLLVDAGFNTLARPVLYGSWHPMSLCPVHLIATHADGLFAWVLAGSGFVSMYGLMVMVWYTALPWAVYQMRRYGVNVRWSRQRARMCVDGLSTIV